MKTDKVFPIMYFEQRISLLCRKNGRVQNDKLFVCRDFEYDSNKPEIVILEKHHRPALRFFVRVGIELPIKIQGDIDPMVRDLYDLVCQVWNLDGRGYMLGVLVNRYYIEKGVVQETVFRAVMKMIEAGFLVREDIGGAVFLRPPSFVVNIGDIKKMRVRS